LNERALLVVGASLSVLGLGLSVSVSESVGAGFTIVGSALGVFGLHRFGRTGADTGSAAPDISGSRVDEPR
jgi:hypothetical protein